MNSDGSHRVVNVKFQIQNLHHHYYQDARHHPHDNGAQSIQSVTACGNPYQSRQGCIQTHRHIRFPVLNPGINHGNASGYGRSNGRSQKNRGQRCSVPGCRSVKAIPSKPENKTPQCSQRNGMALDRIDSGHLSCLIFLILSKPGPHHDCTNQCCDTTH